jgi:hypothetical protein
MTTAAKAIVAVLGALVLAACTTVPLAPGAEQVKITNNPSDVVGCTAVGNLDHLEPPSAGSDNNDHSARNQAIGLGGNTIFDTSPRAPIKLGITTGVVYRCGGPAASAGK